MIKYPKIQTLFLRDVKNIIIPDKFTLPEFEYLKDNLWECTEKIDGTNMSVQITSNVIDNEVNWNVEICGRTEKSEIPRSLLNKMNSLFSFDKLDEVFELSKIENCNPYSIVIYGEGYGNKIQKYGNRYIKDDVDFILFDVKIGNYWLNRSSLESIANKLGIKIVPFKGLMTINEAIDFVKSGFKSEISEDTNLDAEGLVLKTPCGLLGRDGERLITKIKICDFNKWNSVYGNQDNVVQIVNEHLQVIPNLY